MRYRQVGASGLTVSVLGYGCIQFGRTCDLPTARSLVDQAIDSGITLFDTANSYGEGASETYLGEILEGRRQQFVISTKFGSRRQRRPEIASGSRRYITQAVDDCLGRLRTDYIDLYQLHFPDPFTPIEETLRALDDLVHAGKVRYIGSSNFAAWQLVEAEWTARSTGGVRFISAQRQYGLLQREIEADVVPVCHRYALGLFPWRPLANGILSGRFRRGDELPPQLDGGIPDIPVFDVLEGLEAYAAARGVSLIDVAIGGLLAFPAVSAVLVGAGNPDHVVRNAQATEWVPSPDDVVELRRILDDGGTPPA